MFKNLVLYGLSLLALSSTAHGAAAGCDTYSVIPGDTLRLISERYYGVRELSPIIYDANRDVVGANPNTIEIGMKLEIPCRDGMRMPAPIAFLALIEPESRPAPEFAAKAGETPFIRQDGSGIIPDIMAASLRESGYTEALQITRPETIDDVLRIAAKPGALLSFPWVMPHCNDPASLSAQSRELCNSYSFSDPLLEITLGIFTRAGSALAIAETATDFSDKTLCVPQFHTDDMLRHNGIITTSAEIVLASDFLTCMSGLETGTYDAVVADYQSFATYKPDGIDMVGIPAFAHKSTLHAIAYSQNPAAMALLRATNTGLKQILASGAWFAIVNQDLARLGK